MVGVTLTVFSRVREGPTGGEPLQDVPKDHACSFQCEEGQNIVLNKRLPGIAQRDVLPSGRVE